MGFKWYMRGICLGYMKKKIKLNLMKIKEKSPNHLLTSPYTPYMYVGMGRSVSGWGGRSE